MKYRVDMTNSLTVSGLSLSVFMSKYYDNNIPEISQSSMYKDIKLAYYGGMTEVYKPHGKNLYYYDVNSLYPAVAKHDMPGLLSRKILVTGDTNIDALFGFYLVKADATNVSCQYLGLLPFRGKGLMFPPHGKWEGWYFSEELKFVKEYGYNISVIKGYTFSRSTNVFKSYVDSIYNHKVNAQNSTEKTLAKSLLNNLIHLPLRLHLHLLPIVPILLVLA